MFVVSQAGVFIILDTLYDANGHEQCTSGTQGVNEVKFDRLIDGFTKGWIVCSLSFLLA